MLELHDILKKAIEMGASDIHLKVDCGPFMRCNGEITQSGLDVLDRRNMDKIIESVLPPHLRKEFAEAHRADFAHHEKDVGRFRVNAFMGQGQPAIVMRHVKTQVPTTEDLRLPDQLKALSDIERGIIVLAGTTGSGKSSTLAAIIGEINRRHHRRIITVEDPVEYVFEDDKSVVTQREVGPDTLSFQDSLRDMLRQDPDVILIGEMRDETTIRTGLMAAQTGHLVLSTVHASNSASTIPRMLDMFPSSEQSAIRMALAATDLVIICQRLVSDVDGGRVPAVEILINTSTVRKLLESDRLDMLSTAIETGGGDGMQSFDQAIVELIESGTVSQDEGLRAASNPAAIEMRLKGIDLKGESRILGS